MRWQTDYDIRLRKWINPGMAPTKARIRFNTAWRQSHLRHLQDALDIDRVEVSLELPPHRLRVLNLESR